MGGSASLANRAGLATLANSIISQTREQVDRQLKSYNQTDSIVVDKQTGHIANPYEATNDPSSPSGDNPYGASPPKTT